MGYEGCCGPKYKCKKKKCGSCRERIEFDVKCPPPINPLPNVSSVDHRRYTVGGGSGGSANKYTVSVPAGTQFITIRSVGAGGGGGGQLSEVVRYTGGLIDIAQPIQAGGGGGAGLVVDFSRPYSPGMSFPNTLNITVGPAATMATDLTTGRGNDGGDSIISFSPSVPGWEDICAVGGRGGGVGRSTGDGLGEAGEGGDGSLGGGGGGELCLLIGVPPTVILGAPGGTSKSGQNGEKGDNVTGGDGAQNPGSGSSGAAVPEYMAGGGGGGGSSLIAANSGGEGGPPGDIGTSNTGGDFKVQDSGAPGGGAGIYQPTLAEEGSTIFRSGGLAAHGVVDVWFYISMPPS